MSNYLMKFKGTYRILPELDSETNDFVRERDGSIDEDMIYISCQYGNKIWYYGLGDNRRALLMAYIPSITRGRNIKRAMTKDKIEIIGYDESDEEVTFKFNASDIEVVAPLLKVKVSGASISPFSSRNLPKSDIEIPEMGLERYKSIVSKVQKGDMLVIKNINQAFLSNVLEKSLKSKNKKYSYKDDMTSSKMTRQVKEFIYTKGFWEKYLNYLDVEITKFYNN